MAGIKGKATSVYLSLASAARLVELAEVIGISQSQIMDRLVATAKVRETRTVSLENPELERMIGEQTNVEDQ